MWDYKQHLKKLHQYGVKMRSVEFLETDIKSIEVIS